MIIQVMNNIQVIQKRLKKIPDIVLEDRRVKMHETAKIVGISSERIYNVLYEKARWMLTIDKKSSNH